MSQTLQCGNTLDVCSVNLSIYINEVMSSLRSVGLRKTLGHIFGTLADYRFDRKYGIDTAGWIPISDLVVLGSNSEYGENYQPSRVAPLRRVLRQLDIPRDNTFIDIGSGKGRALIIAMEHGFTRVKGIEFAGDLCEIARANTERARGALRTEARPEILHSDVVDYAIQDDDTVFYLFNPFDATVMQSVANAIAESHARTPRDLWVIYFNPLQRQVFEESGIDYETILDLEISGCRFIVFKATGDRQAALTETRAG